MPDHEMVMRHVDSRMAGVEVDADVVRSTSEARGFEGPVIVHVLYGNHVDGRYQAIGPIEAQERTERKRLGFDEDDSQPRKEFREVHEVADPFIPVLFRDLALVGKSVGLSMHIPASGFVSRVIPVFQ